MKSDQIALRKEINDYSKTIGINALGFIKAKPFFAEKTRFEYAREKGYLSNFLNKKIDKEKDVFNSFYKTVISIMVSYPNPLFYDKEKKVENKNVSKVGKFSSSSWGEDYHQVLKEIMEKLVVFIQERTGALRYEILVDTVPFSEREIAVKAGLGWIGKNSNIINDELGSFVFLGEIFIDFDLGEEDKEDIDMCRECNLCVEACPVSAIDSLMRVIDTKKCLSQQTQEKEKDDPLVRKKIGETGFIYGCDICQMVCPYNKKNKSFYKAFSPELDKVYPNLEKLILMSNREFKDKFGHSAGSWRGKNPIIENAKIILGRN